MAYQIGDTFTDPTTGKEWMLKSLDPTNDTYVLDNNQIRIWVGKVKLDGWRSAAHWFPQNVPANSPAHQHSSKASAPSSAYTAATAGSFVVGSWVDPGLYAKKPLPPAYYATDEEYKVKTLVCDCGMNSLQESERGPHSSWCSLGGKP